MMNRKGPWEGYRWQARERRLGTRQALNATDREEGIFIQLLSMACVTCSGTSSQLFFI